MTIQTNGLTPTNTKKLLPRLGSPLRKKYDLYQMLPEEEKQKIGHYSKLRFTEDAIDENTKEVIRVQKYQDIIDEIEFEKTYNEFCNLPWIKEAAKRTEEMIKERDKRLEMWGNGEIDTIWPKDETDEEEENIIKNNPGLNAWVNMSRLERLDDLINDTPKRPYQIKYLEALNKRKHLPYNTPEIIYEIEYLDALKKYYESLKK